MERPFVNKHYVLYSVNAIFLIICEHKFQEDHCLRTARARMLGCSLMETRTCRKNRNTTLRHGDLYWWKSMLLKLHSRWCWSFTPHRRANNALAMRFSVLERMLLLTAHGVPLVLEFHPALTYERFCDSFSPLVGGITVETALDIPLVFLWTLCKVWTLNKVFSLGSTGTRQNARAICFAVLRQKTHARPC